MKRSLAGLVLFLSVTAGNLTAYGVDPVPGDRGSADVSLLVAWLAGSAESKELAEPFGDAGYIAKAKEAFFYSDVDGVKLPKQIKPVPYEFVKPRMELIQRGHNFDPAILITRSVKEESPDGGFVRRIPLIRKPVAGERYYYIEVLIGSLAGYWIKVRVFEADGKTKMDILHAIIS